MFRITDYVTRIPSYAADLVAGALSIAWRRYVCATVGHSLEPRRPGAPVRWCRRCARWIRVEAGPDIIDELR